MNRTREELTRMAEGAELQEARRKQRRRRAWAEARKQAQVKVQEAVKETPPEDKD